MPSWISILVDLWPIASTITPIILLAGFFWLRTKFPLKSDFDALAQKVGSLSDSQIKCDARLEAMEKDAEESPTRVELGAQIGALGHKVSRVEAQTEGVQPQLKRIDDYLQILIERGINH